MGRIIYVTGTDTGVGKTILSALLLCSMRRESRNVLLVKPFSSGERGDGELFQELQPEQTIDRINPWHFRAPIAPAIAAQQENRSVGLSEAIDFIREGSRDCDFLIVEGAGGLLSPLGKNFSLAELIKEIPGGVLVAAQNKLGVLNQSLLTLEALRARSVSPIMYVLMGHGAADESAPSNADALRAWGQVEVVELPELRPLPRAAGDFERVAEVFESVLGQLRERLLR
jgi:dethiobiotin synthetase